MLQRGFDLDLAEEPVGADRCSELGAQDFEGDTVIVASVTGQKDDGHPPTSDLSLDRVLVPYCFLEALQGVSHDTPPQPTRCYNTPRYDRRLDRGRLAQAAGPNPL